MSEHRDRHGHYGVHDEHGAHDEHAGYQAYAEYDEHADYQERTEYQEHTEYAEVDAAAGDAGGAEEPEAARRPASRRVWQLALGGVVVGLLAAGGYGAYNVVSAVTSGSRGDGDHREYTAATTSAPQEPPTAEQAEAVAKDFLAAWGRGDLTAAAALTDRQDSARSALSSFREALKPRSLTLTGTGPAPSGTPSEPRLGFRVKAELEETAGAWEYDGVLGVVRASDGTAVVRWSPAVIHPHLDPGETVGIRPLPNPVVKPTDRNGKPLDAFPSLRTVLPEIRPADGATAVTGQAVVILDGTGKPPEQLFVLAPPSAPEIRLTLDADLQQAAEEAVKQQSAGGKPASLVAVQPSTGHILAMAYSSKDQFNRAVGGGQAPGSTMKVITAAALLEAGVRPDTVVPCKETTNSPRLWHNDEPGNFPGYTLTDDFTHSCNTGFIDKGLEKLQLGTVPSVARDQFGLGLEWHIGIGSRDATIPVPKNKDEAAATYIGQGQIQVNSLLMASVAATVQSGTFRQPVLREDAKRVTAPGKLPPGVARDLRAMMAETATQGTARAPMSGLTGQIGAKTGTVEAGAGRNTNSWFIAYRGDLAVAAEVEGGGHGNSAAGVAAAQVLRAGGKG
ncbi:penicillin-binding protein [Kitasatospora sp. RG8]|uniref:penicillin-binding transpeptidase domain-containing protein n=1 Tax=Kitasatospora sp. RG8 TaxID=2820815 RepID=UPI001ADFFDB2|nr:penicillin-binding transpeptidase domain-containing protein [Kitasatospora sp. RG8]MBP0449211.1 penicillin-binding protein [Kitasatospora sp. RG8]